MTRLHFLLRVSIAVTSAISKTNDSRMLARYTLALCETRDFGPINLRICLSTRLTERISPAFELLVRRETMKEVEAGSRYKKKNTSE
jgi:hypothetical protein